MSNSICYRVLCIACLFFSATLQAQQRSMLSINSNWQFHKGELSAARAGDPAAGWETVSLPHTWNIADAADDEPGYYRGPGSYRKTLYIDPALKGKEIYLHFEGANQVTDVFVNGHKAGTHTGGYTAFSFPITSLLQWADSAAPNELLVKVNNAHSEDIPPLSADFTFYGGIYRDVYLEAVNRVHFDMDNNASPGVFIATPFVSNAYATMEIKGVVSNHSAAAGDWQLETTLLDADDEVIAQQQSTLSIVAGSNASFIQSVKNIRHPRLWSPGDPYLYRVITTISDKQTGRVIDRLSHAWGFRWFQFDANRGFYLNGQPLKLMGTNRHQDYKGLGNALPDALHVNDVRLLKEMGANFIRISHYPQDPAVLEACDRMGILASVEIPVVNRITENKVFAANCLNMQREMIRQNFNHPAVIIWTFMNEILLVPRYAAGSAERDTYYRQVAALARQLDSLTRQEDNARYTMIPNHGSFDLYTKAGITAIPMLVGWNLYQGWYNDSLPDFARFLDRHHRELPDKPLLVSEYGVDALPSLHSFNPERFDKTQEYANRYHEVYEKAIRDRPFVAGAAIWNLVDFNSEGREEASPHINSKGLLSTGRKPKDGYFFYQSKLLRQPYIKIGSSAWTRRAGIAASDNGLYCRQPVTIYTNLPAVMARLNGKKLGAARAIDGIATINVPFRNGDNILEVMALSGRDTLTDMTSIHFQLIPPTLTNQQLPFSDLHISLGDKRFYVNELTGEVWLPEQPYSPGGWGYIGGKPFVMKGSTRIPYGTGKNILGTGLDPVYQTQRVGIDSFRLDVPDGRYEVTLHFCELLSKKERAALANNLDAGAAANNHFSDRSFDVSVNDIPAGRLGTTNYLAPEQSYSSKILVDAAGHTGIIVAFHALKGEAILNGIEVKKL